jgi:hypothetical protein
MNKREKEKMAIYLFSLGCEGDILCALQYADRLQTALLLIDTWAHMDCGLNAVRVMELIRHALQKPENPGASQ